MCAMSNENNISPIPDQPILLAAFGLVERRVQIEGEPDTVAAILGDLVFRIGTFEIKRHKSSLPDWWAVEVSYVEAKR